MFARVVTVLVLLGGALFMTAASAGGTTGSNEAVNLNATVEAGQCKPCHARLGEATYPGLIFSHGNHLMVDCPACHFRQAHIGGTTYRPPMEACFNCHGLQHGPQGELASSKCRDCHTPAFQLQPSSHTKSWKLKPHAVAASRTANSCLLCHNAKRDCDACHQKKHVKVRLDVRSYVPVLPVTKAGPAVKVYPDKPTSESQCVNCHPDLDAFTGKDVIFAHDPHLRRNFACTVCHPKFAHSDQRIARPDMRSCYRCHGLTHSSNGLVAAEDCRKCHPEGFTLKPPDHTNAFVLGAHSERAGKDSSYCSMCHKSKFCVDCHQGRRPRADGSPAARVVPKTHVRADWRAKHGKLYLQQQGACGACHDEKTCTTCHHTPMPHPVNWLSKHNVQEKNRDCNVCHQDRSRCQNCHHGGVGRSALVASSCTPCHKIMSQKPATSIKNKAFAEHAVHFQVVKKKGKPYKCYECHVGFGSQSGVGLENAGHDLRLCYGCHGALNPLNQLIAPYRGAELCRRCHTNLNI